MSSTLYAKMARVMAATSYIEKDGKNPHFGYRFTTDSAVYNTIRQQLADNNLAVFASMVDVMQTEIAKDGGKKTWHTLAKFEFTIADGDSGEKFTCSWQAEADDQQDKGVNKCATAALKYWLLKTFVIPTGDDPDANEPPRHVPKGDQSRRIQTGPVQAPPEPPDDEQQVQQAFTDITWTRNRERVAKMMGAAEQMWRVPRPHAINRVAKALGVENPHGKFEDLYQNMSAYQGSPEDAWNAICAHQSEDKLASEDVPPGELCEACGEAPVDPDAPIAGLCTVCANAALDARADKPARKPAKK
jgi:hypothetical protein